MRLKAADGHEFDAYRAEPRGQAAGGVVVIQEIFGVNGHIRAVCDRFAAEGFLAVSPALFDRIERGVEFDYTDEATTRGRALRAELSWENPLRDIDAAMAAAAVDGAAGVVGFCWGGSLAWLAAARLKPACAVCYYGGQIHDFITEQPRCPALLHFGEKDRLIPREHQERIRAAHPGLEFHFYPADHGFNCDQRASYDAACAALAWTRTIAFLRRNLGR
jgi:carboxymethylenebutenolidase